MCHLDTAQCRILKDSGRFLVKNTKGVRVNQGKVDTKMDKGVKSK